MTVHPIRVAILDDDASIRTGLSRLLRTAEMVVETYATGDHFFASLALKVPNCLLLDFRMPEMSGLDVLTYLGQQRIRMNTIVITGQEETGSRAACMNAGAVAYLCKPLDGDQLVELIENVHGT